MGSLNATGISVVNKTNVTIRNRGGRQIVKSDSASDVETTVVSSPPAHIDGENNIVRSDNSLFESTHIVAGVYFSGRSANARVASKPGVTRDLDVELGDNKTDGVVPEALAGTTPELGVKHTGQKVVVYNSHDDSKTRKSDAGAYQNN